MFVYLCSIFSRLVCVCCCLYCRHLLIWRLSTSVFSARRVHYCLLKLWKTNTLGKRAVCLRVCFLFYYDVTQRKCTVTQKMNYYVSKYFDITAFSCQLLKHCWAKRNVNNNKVRGILQAESCMYVYHTNAFTCRDPDDEHMQLLSGVPSCHIGRQMLVFSGPVFTADNTLHMQRIRRVGCWSGFKQQTAQSAVVNITGSLSRCRSLPRVIFPYIHHPALRPHIWEDKAVHLKLS